MKKFIKQNPIKKALSRFPPDLNGPVFLFGRIGSGKSVTMLSLAQKYKDNLGYKTFELWGGDRHEQNFWAFPSDKKEYWSKVKKKVNFKGDGPKQYSVNYLFPYIEGCLPPKLPDRHGENFSIKSKLFTIPFNSLTTDIISTAIGVVSEQSKANFNSLKEKVKRTDDCAGIYHKMLKIVSKNSTLRRNFLYPLLKNKFIQGNNFKLNLDLVSEMKDREVVSVLVLDFVPKDYRVFIMDWILSSINLLLDEHKIRGKNIYLIREAAEFFRATEQSVTSDNYKIFRTHLAHYVRMGRRGIFGMYDCQSFSEVRGLVSGSQMLTILCKMTGEQDIKEATDELRRTGMMKIAQRNDLNFLEAGQCYFVETSKPAYKQYFFLPRTVFWEPGMPTFFNLWKRKYDTWENIEGIKIELKDLFNNSLIKIEDEEKIQEALKQEKEDLKKEKEELRKTEKEIFLKRKKQELQRKMLGTSSRTKINEVNIKNNIYKDKGLINTIQNNDIIPKTSTNFLRNSKEELSSAPLSVSSNTKISKEDEISEDDIYNIDFAIKKMSKQGA